METLLIIILIVNIITLFDVYITNKQVNTQAFNLAKGLDKIIATTDYLQKEINNIEKRNDFKDYNDY